MRMTLRWPTAAELAETMPAPPGYDYMLPAAADVPRLVRAVDDWFPGLAVSNASCFLREDFYTGTVVVVGLILVATFFAMDAMFSTNKGERADFERSLENARRASQR